MRITLSELKSGLSRWVARARAGEVIGITSHGKPVARLVGVPAAGPAGALRLLARGAATWDGGKPALHPPVVLSEGGTSLCDIVQQDRQ
jgi:prevent-host-death family protein